MRTDSTAATRRLRRLGLGALIATTLAASSAGHASQGADLIANFTDFSSWSLLGSATATTFDGGNGFVYSTLALTQFGSGEQAGAAFAPERVALDFNLPFRFAWTWFIPVYDNIGLRGDGFAFVLSNSATLGGAGSGLGYEGQDASSIAFAVDTFNFSGEPQSPSIQLLSGGSVTPLAATETGLGDTIRDVDFSWFGELVFTPSGNGDSAGTLLGTITHATLGSFSVASTIDFNALAMDDRLLYFGFAGANGLAADGHVILSAAAIPEPGTWAMMLAGLAAVGFVASRRR